MLPRPLTPTPVAAAPEAFFPRRGLPSAASSHHITSHAFLPSSAPPLTHQRLSSSLPASDVVPMQAIPGALREDAEMLSCTVNHVCGYGRSLATNPALSC